MNLKSSSFQERPTKPGVTQETLISDKRTKYIRIPLGSDRVHRTCRSTAIVVIIEIIVDIGRQQHVASLEFRCVTQYNRYSVKLRARKIAQTRRVYEYAKHEGRSSFL